jgi:hypothetical protein
MAYWDKLDGGGDDLDAGSTSTPSSETPGTDMQGTDTQGTDTPSTGTQATGNYWPAGEDYWPAAEAGWRRLGDAGTGEPDEAAYDYEDGQP